jgi:hypothetical protein
LVVLGLVALSRFSLHSWSSAVTLAGAAASLIIGMIWVTGSDRSNTEIASASANRYDKSESVTIMRPHPSAAAASGSGEQAQDAVASSTESSVSGSIDVGRRGMSSSSSPQSPAMDQGLAGQGTAATPALPMPAEQPLASPKGQTIEPADPAARRIVQSVDEQNQLAEKAKQGVPAFGRKPSPSGGEKSADIQPSAERPEKGEAAADSKRSSFGSAIPAPTATPAPTQSTRMAREAAPRPAAMAAPAAAKGPAATDRIDAAASSSPTSPSPGAPASLYFNPQLKTDAQGIATVQFRMPSVASEYRILLDGVGQGRIGSSHAVIVCQPEPRQ